jgi:hypothetical protein
MGHQLLVYADDVNLLADTINNIKKNREFVIETSEEVYPDIDTEKTKYMLLSHHQNSGQNHIIKRANTSF